jgi:hypothetical protein
METDHIVQVADAGSDEIENAIPVCLECHAEIHAYNDRHPRGRKFYPEELRQHKKQWLNICANRPEVLIGAAREIDVGPLQALVDELEFNLAVIEATRTSPIGCPFRDEEIGRAIRAGAIATLREDVRDDVLRAYVKMRDANQYLSMVLYDNRSRGNSAQNARATAMDAKDAIQRAHDCLGRFLGGSAEDETR